MYVSLEYLEKKEYLTDHRQLAFSCRTPLTPRQREILLYAASGMLRKEIARDLHISTNTIKEHIYRMYNTLEELTGERPTRLSDAAFIAHRMGWLR
jgi:DNA-binding NarL/FixJ family response regulator